MSVIAFILDNLPAFLILWLGAAAALAALHAVFLAPAQRAPYPPELYPSCRMCIEAFDMSRQELVRHQISVHGRVRW